MKRLVCPCCNKPALVGMCWRGWLGPALVCIGGGLITLWLIPMMALACGCKP